MAILDYKITNLSHDKRQVKVSVIIYRGNYQNINYVDAVTGLNTVANNVYVRIAKVRAMVFEYEVPRDMTRHEFIEKARAYLNDKVVTFAQKNGHTVISKQTDKSGLEPVLNEKEI